MLNSGNETTFTGRTGHIVYGSGYPWAQRSHRSSFPMEHRSHRSSFPMEHRSHRSGFPMALRLIGRQVKINRGGPEMIEGVLLAVNGEVLVLSAEGTTIYVNGRHVKSVTEGKSRGTGNKRSRGNQSTGKSGGSSAHIASPTFNGVLAELRQQFVQINHGGPEMMEGFLADTAADHILLIVGRDFVRIPVFHIRTVSPSGKQSSGSRGNQNQSRDGGSGKSSRSGGSNRKRNRKRNEWQGAYRG